MRTRRAFIRVLGGAAVLLLAACGGAAAGVGSIVYNTTLPKTVGPPATGSGMLVIVHGDNLFSVPAAGGTETQLTNETNSNFANNPAFSPDGKLIAYTHHIAPTGNEWGGAELHVMNADGTGDRTLVPSKDKGERAETPAWSPDGKLIYFAHDIPIIDASNHYTGDELTIETVDLGTGQRKVIAKDAIMPAVAQQTLAWANYDPSTSAFRLMVAGLDGSNPKTLLTEKDFQALYSMTVSPDGKQILFAGSGRTNSTVAGAIGVIGALLNPLVPGIAQAHGLPWDPWIINADGRGLRRVVSMGSDEQALAWSPDGQEIAMANLSATFLMRSDGTGFTKLLPHGDPGGISWKAG